MKGVTQVGIYVTRVIGSLQPREGRNTGRRVATVLNGIDEGSGGKAGVGVGVNVGSGQRLGRDEEGWVGDN